jgi:hypothetical protein
MQDVKYIYPSDTFAYNFDAYLFLRTSNSRNYASHTNHGYYTAYLDTGIVVLISGSYVQLTTLD